MNQQIKRKITRTVKRFFGANQRFSELDYWRNRARKFGDKAVFNAKHSDEELQQITELQKRILIPILKSSLTGEEGTLLDFGCGTGRFSEDLARTIGGRVVAVDPIQELLERAPHSPMVEYRVMQDHRIPLSDCSVEVVWICLVLGGIVAPVRLKKSVEEIRRVISPGGLLMLIENTSMERTGPAHWRFRSVDEYKRIFDFVDLDKKGEYKDFSETISVMLGRVK